MFRGYLERNSFLIMFQKDIAKKERKEMLLNTVRDYSEYSTIQVPFKRKFNITKKRQKFSSKRVSFMCFKKAKQLLEKSFGAFLCFH